MMRKGCNNEKSKEYISSMYSVEFPELFRKRLTLNSNCVS